MKTILKNPTVCLFYGMANGEWRNRVLVNLEDFKLHRNPLAIENLLNHLVGNTLIM